MSNNPRHDLSSLSREELMNLIAGQQSQLRSQQQQQLQQQQRQNQQLQLQQQQQQQQQQNFWLGQSSASLLHDRLLAAPSGLTSANLSGLAALLGGSGNASASSATGVTSNSGLTELLGLGGAGSTSSLLQGGGGSGGTFHDGNGVGSPQTGAELLQRARARLAAGVSSDPLTHASSTMRNLMLRQELLGGQFASLHPLSQQPLSQQQHGHGRSGSGTELPPVGSDEDLLLRNLITSEARGRAIAAAQQELAAARGGVDLTQHQRSFLLDQAAAQQNPALAGLILRNFGLGSGLGGGNAANASVGNGIAIGTLNCASLSQVSSGVSSADPLRSAAQEDGTPREADEEEEEKKVAPAVAGVGKNAKHKKSKRPLSAYNIFFKEEHAKIIAENEKVKAEKRARGEPVSSDDEYEEDPDAPPGENRKRRRTLSTNQPGKRGKRQVDFENLTKVIGKRWKELPKERVEEYKRQAEEAMQEYRKNLFQKIRQSVKDDQVA